MGKAEQFSHCTKLPTHAAHSNSHSYFYIYIYFLIVIFLNGLVLRITLTIVLFYLV